MSIPPDLNEFWNTFEIANGQVDQQRFYEASYFGDSEDLANDLGGLVLRGVKRGTAGALWSYEITGKRLPAPHDLSIVTDWSGKPLCVIETHAVEIVAFQDVAASFAQREGEGDGSLSFWQNAHREYFARECANADRCFTEQILVVCESFEMIYKPLSSEA